jgi:uncharacterized membrane protein YecN with MAPEG domain
VLFPIVTAGYAAILALLFAVLSALVVTSRVRLRVNHGDGGKPILNRLIRAHANFAEYVPLILLLVALIEAGGVARGAVHALLLPLLVVRTLHPIGMLAPEASLRQFACRGSAAIVTWLVLIVAAALLLNRALQGGAW